MNIRPTISTGASGACRRHSPQRIGGSLLVVWLLLIGGCAATPPRGAASYPTSLTAEERQLSRERAALERVLAAEHDATRLTSLQRAALDAFLPHEERARALAALLEQDATAAEAVTAQLIISLPPGVWANELCGLAADRGWRSCVGSLVLRAHELHDVLATAIEAEALVPLDSLRRTLAVDDLPQALWRVVSNPGEAAVPRARAWELYVAIVGVDAARNQLLTPPSASAGLLADLRRCAAELHCVPRSLEEIITVRTLLGERTAGAWSRWSAMAASLPAGQRRDLALRHFPALQAAADCRPDLLSRSRLELLTELERALGRARRVSPSPTGQVVTDLPDALQHWAEQLAWGDLITLALLLEALEGDPTFRAAIREQVELDLSDDEQELGGLVRQTPPHGARRGCLLLEPFASGSASLGDVAFRPPEEMRRRSHLAVAQYHLHAQARNSDANAGPGRGDLRYAARSGALCLLATPCGRRGINLDCFARLHSGRVFILDLGTIDADES